MVECAAVIFINQANNLFFLIKCNYCNEKYEWSDYGNHFQSEHMQEARKTDSSDGQQILNEVYEEIEEEHLDEIDDSLEQEQRFETEHELGEEADLEIDSDTGKSEKFSAVLNRPFFRLRKTPTKIMLKFIDILRQHPIQWDVKSPDFTQKDRRDESSIALSLQLRQHLNINVTPQGARSSALALIRWFEREYIRFLGCEEKDLQFICNRGEYFEKLLQFLPYKHLQMLNCKECERRFKSEHLLLVHKHKQHKGQVPFKCRYCGRGFIHPSSHRIHENRHVKINLWPCMQCLYQATSKADYVKHKATHSPEQPYKCDICGLAYKTRSNLNIHKKSHSLVPEYECKICKKQFFEKYRFKRHQWIHKEEMQASFLCSICCRRFASKNTLLKHQVVHMLENYNLEGEEHVTPAIRGFMKRCVYCSLEFINNDAYETHMKLKHKMEIKRN